jgi:hypothetical protein
MLQQKLVWYVTGWNVCSVYTYASLWMWYSLLSRIWRHPPRYHHCRPWLTTQYFPFYVKRCSVSSLNCKLVQHSWYETIYSAALHHMSIIDTHKHISTKIHKHTNTWIHEHRQIDRDKKDSDCKLNEDSSSFAYSFYCTQKIGVSL